ncbi:hypothetical protein TR51_21730 [Kitasatospora griseola]|uniref:Uncharacterized protein n=1 Tax=Kitasatospora griseola TaxID=2064 RepID=A0A0D0PTA6_KITGR|nr:hypothetical protein TR51_21730 [Kitasatospora griseola]
MLALAFVAAVESAEAAEPGDGALDHPSVSAEALGGVDASAGDARWDPASSQVSADESVIVGFVAVELAGPASPGAAA